MAQNISEALHKFGEAFHELAQHVAQFMEQHHPQETRPVPPPAVQPPLPEGTEKLPEDGA